MNQELHESQFASRIRHVLDQGTSNLDQKAVARLYQFRQDALCRQAAPVAVLSLAGIGHLATESLHSHYRGILAFLALVIGAMGVQFWQNARQATELAEIDSALLADEVSPNAYTDQGFIEWLNHLSQQEEGSEESLPQ
ncbi:MAG TPA: DUF3619 family protein [Rhodocyclaceae bacterium]|nr:DUF3619 family protein [Rhodocyclaceae bacterium]